MGASIARVREFVKEGDGIGLEDKYYQGYNSGRGGLYFEKEDLVASWEDHPGKASLVAQTVKYLSTMWETLVRSLGRAPGEGNGNPLQNYCLENPMDRGAW